MGFKINTNIGAMNAHLSATSNNLGLNNSLTSLSTGLRINKAADDASGLAIGHKLSVQAKGLGQAMRNTNDAIGLIQTADGALEEFGNILVKIRTLAVKAANDTKDDESRSFIRLEANALLAAAEKINSSTRFHNINILDGSGANNGEFTFHTGAYVSDTIRVNIASNSFNDITNFVGNDIAMTSRAYAEGIISAMDVGIENLALKRTTLGTAQNQLESVVRNISHTKINIESAQSQIQDIDFASESVSFARHNILAQSGSYAMSQANVLQDSVLTLLK